MLQWGNGDKACFHGTGTLTKERGDSMLVRDRSNHSVRQNQRRVPHGQCTTVVGKQEKSFAAGVDDTARFKRPKGIRLDGESFIYVADLRNYSALRQHLRGMRRRGRCTARAPPPPLTSPSDD